MFMLNHQSIGLELENELNDCNGKYRNKQDMLTRAMQISEAQPSLMVEPRTPLNTERTADQLDSFMLFCVLVAGKNADVAANVVNRMMLDKPKDVRPLQWLADNTHLLHFYKVGQYSRVTKTIQGLLELDLRSCTMEELINVHGVGLKTASFFLLYTRQCEVAVLDRHVLRWLKDNFDAAKSRGLTSNRSGASTRITKEDVPDQAPTEPGKYMSLQREVMKRIAVVFPGLSAAEADLQIWLQYSGRLEDEV